MTQTDLFAPHPSPVAAPRAPRAPRVAKPSRTDLVVAYFKARPHEWIDGMRFAEFAGQYAWRSRIADARKRGMTIENRQRATRDFMVSEYKYVPEAE